MIRTDIENLIRDTIDNSQGLKGQELVLKIMSRNLSLNNNDMMDTLFDMIERGEFIEVECVFPTGISKSFILPKGTLVNVINKVRVK